MVLNGMQHDVVVHTAKKIKTKRDMDGPFVVSQPEDKRYNITFFKRRGIDGNDSLPYGYVTADTTPASLHSSWAAGLHL